MLARAHLSCYTEKKIKMANGYYYLVTALPELSLTDKDLEFNMVSYRDFLMEELDPKDAKLLKVLYYPYDIINLVNLIKENGQEWDLRGSFTHSELDAMLLVPHTLPEFMQQFYDETRTHWDDWSEKQLIDFATALYIDWSREAPNKFLRQWLYFSQNLKSLLIWLNSHKFKLDANKEVLGNNYEAEYLRNTLFEDVDLRSWDLTFKEALAHFDNPNVALREFLIDQMRWKYLDELEENYSFGIERLMAYVIRLQIINRNIVTTEEAGRERLKQLQLGIVKDYQMPETFN